MNIEDIKALIKAVSESDLAAFDYKDGDSMLSLKRENEVRTVTVKTQEIATVSEKLPEETAKREEGYVVKSPLVGTVYVAPEEGAEPFVRVGDQVKKGQTLAIVEAMKLMNAIECEKDGVISEILIENAHTVEYGQEMFVIC